MTESPHSTELPTRDHLSDFWAGADVYAHIFRELRAALPPEQAEAVEAILCGPFYDGPYKVSGAATQPIPPLSPPPDGLLTPAAAARKPRKPPTLTSVAKQASKAAIAVARYEVKPDGTV